MQPVGRSDAGTGYWTGKGQSAIFIFTPEENTRGRYQTGPDEVSSSENEGLGGIRKGFSHSYLQETG